MVLATLLDFERDWYQFQETSNLTLTLPPYVQDMSQENGIQWILP